MNLEVRSFIASPGKEVSANRPCRQSFVAINGFIAARSSIELKDTLNIEIDISNKSIYEIREELFNLKDYEDKILLLKFMGELNGSISGLKLNEITFKNAFVVLKNLSRIKTKEAKEVILKEENIEEQLIEEYNTEFKDLIKDLMIILDKEKEEGEKNIDFEKRIIEEATKHLNLFN